MYRTTKLYLLYNMHTHTHTVYIHIHGEIATPEIDGEPNEYESNFDWNKLKVNDH